MSLKLTVKFYIDFVDKFSKSSAVFFVDWADNVGNLQFFIFIDNEVLIRSDMEGNWTEFLSMVATVGIFMKKLIKFGGRGQEFVTFYVENIGICRV